MTTVIGDNPLQPEFSVDDTVGALWPPSGRWCKGSVLETEHSSVRVQYQDGIGKTYKKLLTEGKFNSQAEAFNSSHLFEHHILCCLFYWMPPLIE